MSPLAATSSETAYFPFAEDFSSPEETHRWRAEPSSSADLVLDSFKERVYGPIIKILKSHTGSAESHYKPFLRTISNASKRIAFKNPIVVVVERDPGLIILTHEPTRIFGTGESLQEALKDFEDSFIRVYLSYIETPREQLSDTAMEFVERLKVMVESCEDV